MNKPTEKKASAKRRGSVKRLPSLKQRLETALRAHFQFDTVDVSDGYKGNVHVLVVSRKFDGKGEYERQEMLHEIINSAGLSKPQIGKISLLLAMSPGEIK